MNTSNLRKKGHWFRKTKNFTARNYSFSLYSITLQKKLKKSIKTSKIDSFDNIAIIGAEFVQLHYSYAWYLVNKKNTFFVDSEEWNAFQFSN